MSSQGIGSHASQETDTEDSCTAHKHTVTKCPVQLPHLPRAREILKMQSRRRRKRGCFKLEIRLDGISGQQDQRQQTENSQQRQRNVPQRHTPGAFSLALNGLNCRAHISHPLCRRKIYETMTIDSISVIITATALA